MLNKRKANRRDYSCVLQLNPSSSDGGSPGKFNGTVAFAESGAKTELGRSPAKKQAVWSKKSELALLKLIDGFNDQSASDGASFSKKGFLAFIAKSSLAGVFTESQVIEKIKRMKKKYRQSDGGTKTLRSIQPRVKSLTSLPSFGVR